MSFFNLAVNRMKIVAGMARYHYLGERKPVFAHLLLTNRCNLDCHYCFVDVNTIYSTDLNLEEWKKTVLELRDQGCVAITLMGGEPLLFKGLDQLVDYANSLGLSIDLITNGIGIEKHFATVSKMNSVMVSLDGPLEENDINRGKRSFDYACNAIKELKKKNVPVRINCVVTRQNKECLPWLLDFAEQNRAPITFNLPSEFPHDAKEFEHQIMPSPKDVREFYTELLEYKLNDPVKGPLILASEETLSHILDYPLPYQEIVWRTENDVMNSKNTCLFGQTWIHINSNGDIYPCSQLWNKPESFQPKNVRTDGVTAALKNSSDLKCKTCFCLAPSEWRRTFTFKGMLDGAKVTLMQGVNK